MPVRLLFRLQRIGLIATAYFGIFYALVNSAAYPLLAGSTSAGREAFGAQVVLLAKQVGWLLPLPLHPETAAGYLQWRGYGVAAIVFSVWAAMSACGAARRDEDRGLVEQWLGSGISRVRLLATRIGAFAVVSAGAVILTGVAGWLGCAIAGLPTGAAGVAGESAALWALSLAAYGIGLLVAQLTAEFRGAAGIACAVLLVLFLVDSLGRSSADRSVVTQVSIFALYNRSNAVAPGGIFDSTATLLLLVVALAAMAAAALAFTRRDIGAGLITPRPRRAHLLRAPSANPLLGLPVLRGLWIRRVGLLLWTGASAVFAGFVVSLVGVTYDLFTKTPALSGYLRGLGGDIRLVLLALIWFSIAQALMSIIAITQVSRWAKEDSEGVLEMVLAEPVSRTRVLLERAAELAATLVLVSFVSSAVILARAPSQHIDVSNGTLWVATALLVPFGLTFAALGAILAGWRPRLAVGVLSVVAVVSYLVFQIAPLFKAPGWITDLSMFQLYGTPLITPVFLGGVIAMSVIVVTGFAAASVVLIRRDVAA